MTQLIFTDHAIARCQQRGITRALIEIILQYGEERFQGKGCSLIFIPQAKIRQLKLSERLSGVGLLIKDDVLVSAKHITKHITVQRAAHFRGRES